MLKEFDDKLKEEKQKWTEVNRMFIEGIPNIEKYAVEAYGVVQVLDTKEEYDEFLEDLMTLTRKK